MELHGWGRYPRLEAQVARPRAAADCAGLLAGPGPLIARGLGRSYGDSALAAQVLSTASLDHFQAFDPATGVLRCEAGVSLADILRCFVPRGWFLPVTPGTRFVTVGGAIASDVHGKNHHLDGTFANHVRSLVLLLGNGECVTASPGENAELFHATCGGMGLTGIILGAEIQLQAIRSSEIVETTLRCPDLGSVLQAFDTHARARYSVAWIDCLARGARLGRSLLMLGDHAQEGPLGLQPGAPLPVPVDLPAGLLNRSTMRAFNALYYRRVRQARSTRRIPFEPFFYPLDALANWNRLYGRPGFVQYQFVLPRSAGLAGLREVLERIAASGRGSFLAVLKVFGPANRNLLSFPTEGYTLALDFKAEPAVFELLDTLDRSVLQHGGRLYLTKDARMSEATFKAGYPQWQAFEDVRARWFAHGRFASAQSRRLGLS
ncbi:MAG: FAD-binding oxidoreductase [Burkholderiales bacterium]|nr:FAD-binding oxidoreductase [Burkholderiales bacterium]